MAQRYLALDLGAESGRGVVGEFDGATVTLQEVHRFPNAPVRMSDTLYWNLPSLMTEVRTAIGKASEGGAIASLGVDTWGVDFGLLDRGGRLVGLPVHYRDARCNGMVEKVYEKVPRSEVFASSGIQTMQINTLFQLAALAEQSPRLLDAADTLLFMPDLLHFYLTGTVQAEYTIASTSQMFDSVRNAWAVSLLEKAGIPTHFLPTVVSDGTSYGTLTATEAAATGAGPVPVVAPGGHDTACAVAAVPAEGEDWAYLSSGTWSLLGVEIPAPILNPESEAANITNEGGVRGTIRLLKNIGGLWLVQECRRAYARLGTDRTYEQLTRLAAEAEPLAAIIDPDHPSLLAPSDMPKAIRELCMATGQTPPEGIGATIRCCLDSLGWKYRVVLRTLGQLTGRPIRTLHIVGGGSQNYLLNQIAADATGCVVLAGPTEATATGNILLQAMAAGRIANLAELRAVVRASSRITRFEPDPAMVERWAEATDRFSA
ncbi:MAG: rhamnulokinase family protein [Capsulimonadales bacterium]|nr:rhamnulokinase family protein [Capsulimonadales bacterium]